MPHGRVVSTCTDIMEEIIALGNEAEMYIRIAKESRLMH